MISRVSKRRAEGAAVLAAMAQMKPARRKFMVKLARALRDMQ
jgi:hypothetical protein